MLQRPVHADASSGEHRLGRKRDFHKDGGAGARVSFETDERLALADAKGAQIASDERFTLMVETTRGPAL